MASEDILPPETFSEDLLPGNENEVLANMAIDENNMETNAKEDEDETQHPTDTEHLEQQPDTADHTEPCDNTSESGSTNSSEVAKTVEIAAAIPDPAATSHPQGNSEPPEKKLLQLPVTRVRNIMKLDPDMQAASTEAVFAVTRATELFIESFAKTCYNITLQHKKKTIQKQDIDDAIREVDSLWFLEGALWPC